MGRPYLALKVPLVPLIYLIGFKIFSANRYPIQWKKIKLYTVVLVRMHSRNGLMSFTISVNIHSELPNFRVSIPSKKERGNNKCRGEQGRHIRNPTDLNFRQMNMNHSVIWLFGGIIIPFVHHKFWMIDGGIDREYSSILLRSLYTYANREQKWGGYRLTVSNTPLVPILAWV